MIAWLSGRVLARAEDHLVLDVGGVGYRVFAPAALLESVTEGESLSLHVSTQVREDAIHLYGFASPAEREAFRALLGVSGVGARTALAVLSALGRDGLARAVAAQDLKALQRVPGVGRRTAQRVAVELSGRLGEPPSPSPPRPVPAPAPGDPLPLALARLGFRRSEIDRALAGLPPELAGASLEERLQAALRLLGGER